MKKGIVAVLVFIVLGWLIKMVVDNIGNLGMLAAKAVFAILGVAAMFLMVLGGGSTPKRPEYPDRKESGREAPDYTNKNVYDKEID